MIHCKVSDRPASIMLDTFARLCDSIVEGPLRCRLLSRSLLILCTHARFARAASTLLDTFARLVRLHRSKDRRDTAFFRDPLLVLCVTARFKSHASIFGHLRSSCASPSLKDRRAFHLLSRSASGSLFYCEIAKGPHPTFWTRSLVLCDSIASDHLIRLKIGDRILFSSFCCRIPRALHPFLDIFARLVRLHPSKDRRDTAFVRDPLLVLCITLAKIIASALLHATTFRSLVFLHRTNDKESYQASDCPSHLLPLLPRRPCCNRVRRIFSFFKIWIRVSLSLSLSSSSPSRN